jgi:hypothetical protein
MQAGSSSGESKQDSLGGSYGISFFFFERSLGLPDATSKNPRYQDKIPIDEGLHPQVSFSIFDGERVPFWSAAQAIVLCGLVSRGQILLSEGWTVKRLSLRGGK